MTLRGLDRPMPTAALGAVLLSVIVAAAVAQGQNAAPSAPGSGSAAPGSEDEARRQFGLGVDAMRDERYTDALTAFEASYAIRRAPSVSLNLGITLRALGRLVESRHYLEEFMRQASPTQHTEHDQTVQTYLMDLTRRIGLLVVTEPLPEGAMVTIDGARAALDGDASTPIDPGDHTVTASLAGYRRAREQVHITAGQRATVALHLEALATPHPTATTSEDSSSPAPLNPIVAHPASTPFWRSGWFWGAVGVVVAAAVIVPIAVTAGSGYNDPADTSTGRVIQASQR